MTQEDKQLLLKDLCARLPYRVKIMRTGWDSDGDTDFETVETLIGIDDRFIYTIWDRTGDRKKHCLSVSNWKPYLRSMSSMTEEEKVQLCQYACIGEDLNGEFIDEVQRKDCAAYIDWLNVHHFDYRGLIEKRLALEAPEGMYNLKVR